MQKNGRDPSREGNLRMNGATPGGARRIGVRAGLWRVLLLVGFAVSPTLARAADVVLPSAVVPTPAQLTPKPGAGSGSTPELPSRKRAPPQLGKPQEDIYLDVERYAVPPDAPLALRQALPALTAPFVGKHRDFEDLQDAALAVTRFLQRNLGYYLGYAYIPAQVPDRHVVQIAILPGRLDHVELNWDPRIPVRKSVVLAYLERLQPGAIITVKNIERSVFLISDLYGLGLRVDVKPGRLPGTAIVVFSPRPQKRVSGSVTLDADGSPYIGRYRIGARLTVASPLGIGDGLSLSALESTTGGLKFALLGYTAPIGGSGLKAGLAVSSLRYAIDSNIFPIGYTGSATAVNVFALYPIVRSRNLNLFVVGGGDDKRYDDSISQLDTRKTVRDVSLQFSGDFRDAWLRGGIGTFDLSVEHGRIDLSGLGGVGNDDAPTFDKFNFGVTRLQNLVPDHYQLYVAVHGQWALDNLDTTEQFRVGGPDGVRAFAPGEGSSDSGVLGSLELRWLPPQRLFGRMAREMVLAAFVDAAEVQFRHDPNVLPRAPGYRNTASYQGIGISLAMSRPGHYGLTVSLARPLRGVTTADTTARDPRLFAQFTKQF